MKERPIIFSAPMVRAVLAGTKTQTRRLVGIKGVDPTAQISSWGYLGSWDWEKDKQGRTHRRDVTGAWRPLREDGEALGPYHRCPYGVPGDRLWVRETWSIGGNGPFYRADTLQPETVRYSWTPSIHMPRWASRITLEITDVRVQRLQDISSADIAAEGVEGIHPMGGAFPNQWRERFRSLWESINGKRAPWESNPWVWAITFRKVA